MDNPANAKPFKTYFTETKEVVEGIKMFSSAKEADGVILGEEDEKIIFQDPESKFSKNIAVFGPHGSERENFFTRNAVFSYVKRGESFILISDNIDSFLCDKFQKYLAGNGYIVEHYNLTGDNRVPSQGWDFMGEITRSKDPVAYASELAWMLLDFETDAKKLLFYSEKRTLLTALLLRVALGRDYGRVRPRSLDDVLDILTDWSFDLDGYFYEDVCAFPEIEPALEPYDQLAQLSENMLGHVASDLAARLAMWVLPALRFVRTAPEIDLTLPGRRKCAYFVSTTATPLASALAAAFVSFAYEDLMNYADDQESKRLDVPVNIIWDDFSDYPAITGLDRKLALSSDYGISTALIAKSVGRLEIKYSETWFNILAKCPTQLFLRVYDIDTVDYILGSVKSFKMRQAKRKGHLFCLEDSLFGMDIAMAFLLLPNRGGNFIQKFPFTKHPEYAKLG